MPDDAFRGLSHGPDHMQAAPASVRNWLIVVAAMIFFMMVIGALTRLTESGLSMVEWRPVTGWLPPLSEAAWQTELQKYLSSPQGRLINRGFTIAEFKEIFWLEYIHRLWGRLIGVAFALPLVWFWVRRRLSSALKPRLLALLALGGLQGALGWAMVASGLVDRPAVSHYRLAGHLLLAVVLYGYTIWLILELGPQSGRRADPPIRRVASALVALLLVTLTWGALVAGLRAGTAHNTFPTMSGHWIPPGLFDLSPWWINPFENPTTVQFVHRWLAVLLVLGVLVLGFHARRTEAWMAVVMAVIQLGLGIATILTGVDITAATLHQAGAVILLTFLIVVRHRSMSSRAGSVSAMVGA
ncbi:MAG: heme A synthase [Planctomycetes bacterium]|nr:heme A synthase [Planctomycetota bacterium]